jgi:hypothetical protein
MNRNFDRDSLIIRVDRNSSNQLILILESDYSQSAHKSQLYVNEGRFTQALESLWKSIKTKKLLSVSAGFGEIDWYDDEVDVYETPCFYIKRGLKRARTEYRRHGSIPKDWNYHMYFNFADTTTVTPIIEALKKTLYSLFTPEIEKQFTKKLRPVLQKKVKYCSFDTER